RGIPEIGADLPLPDALADLFAARVAGLAEPMRRALLAVALDPRLSRSELETLVDPLAVEDAIASGILAAEGSRLRPSHPRLGAAAARGPRARGRRDVPLELAAPVAAPPLRARHLALATSAPDEALAAEVAAASALAAERGSIQDAAELAAHALRLTP